MTTEFQRMCKRRRVRCDICGANMLPVYGNRWDCEHLSTCVAVIWRLDRFVCQRPTCGAKITFPTNTVEEGRNNE